MLGEIPWGQIQSLPALKELVKLCKGDSTSSPGRQERVRQGIFSLGLIVDQAAASELLKLFSANDNFVSDPILGILKLNVCLPAGEFV